MAEAPVPFARLEGRHPVQITKRLHWAPACLQLPHLSPCPLRTPPPWEGESAFPILSCGCGHSPSMALGEGFGLWAVLPSPKRALWAHGLPLRGSQAQAHLTHPAATRLESGAHAS